MNGKDQQSDNALPPAPRSLAESPGEPLERRTKQLARRKAATLPEEIKALSPEETKRMFHELRVHQIELEMQNEELRASQLALDAARARYFDLYDLAPVGYCTVSERGLILQANLTLASLLGMARGALLRRPLSALICKDDQDRYYLQRKQLVEHGDALSCELRMLKSDGTQFWAHLAATTAQDDGAAVLRVVISDISARKRTEKALVKAEVLQSAIFNSANFAIIATDEMGIIQLFNVGAERMLGYAAADVINKITPADLSDPQELIARAEALSIEQATTIQVGFETLVYKASRDIEDQYELTHVRKDGSAFPAVVSVTALRNAQNGIIGYLLIGTDNTARKRVEAERAVFDQLLQDKNVELEGARIAAEKANLAKSEFLSSMSHELRTPLSAILGFAQLVESGTPAPTPVQKRSIDQILKAGWYLLELINEILDLAVIESGKLSMSIEPVSLAEVLRECESMIEPQAQKHGINVVFPSFENPCYILADRVRVKQVLINLLSNAIKYNRPSGTVAVTFAVQAPDRVRIGVRDTGEGLTPEELAQLFQPFNRLGRKGRVEEGTGIGLVVCKRLVELMLGVIGVDSTVGKGSMFWIELNLTTEPLPAARRGEATTRAEAPVHGDGPSYSLLYVEDNPANLMLVKDIVARRPDIRLRSAGEGKRGIELARAALPDVILMDINLPDISGLDALEILAADSTTAHIPVIALSANALPREIERGLEAGFFRYLTKPIKIAEFLDTLDSALKFAQKEALRASKDGKTP